MTTGAPDPRATARIAYVGLTVGCIAIAAVFTVFARSGQLGGLPSAVQWIALPGLVGIIGLRALLRSRLRSGGADTTDWWATRLPGALVLWGIEEAFFVTATVLWALTGGAALLLQAGVAFGLLLWDRPGNLERGP